MEVSDVNRVVIDFLRSIDDESVDEIIERWSTDKNQSLLVAVNKIPRIKSAYLFFCDFERERLRNQNPPVVNNEAVKVIMSKNWALLKEKGGVDYEKFVTLSNGGRPIYEITKPFHKFSLSKRKGLEIKHGGESAHAITLRLRDEWKALSREEKNCYVIKN